MALQGHKIAFFTFPPRGLYNTAADDKTLEQIISLPEAGPAAGAEGEPRPSAYLSPKAFSMSGARPSGLNCGA